MSSKRVLKSISYVLFLHLALLLQFVFELKCVCVYQASLTVRTISVPPLFGVTMEFYRKKAFQTELAMLMKCQFIRKYQRTTVTTFTTFDSSPPIR